uniref:Receptor L-domain domain-containing protein n=1 Tax=Eptatretus burgeri TaxID=7764 RepID=A0A8C4QAH2_EPTBU
MQFRSLRRAFAGCQLVQGNLEITNMGRHHDLSFLKSIQEVSGYVLVALNEVEEIPLENLHLIRGARLYMGRYALAVMVNYNKAEGGRVRIGLQHLNLHKLTEILIGGVYITKNRYLCHVNTIDWNDIVSPRSLVHIEMDNTTVCECGNVLLVVWLFGVSLLVYFSQLFSHSMAIPALLLHLQRVN